MSNGRTRQRRKDRGSATRTTIPRRKAGYREYLERCEAAGRAPLGFVDFLRAAKRYRSEHEQARREQNHPLVRELEDPMCE